MTAIGGAFAVIGCRLDISRDSTAVLEAEAEIVCAIRVALVCCAVAVFGGELEIHANPDPALQADSKDICAVGIPQISRHSIVFRSPKQIPPNALPVFETTPEVIQPSRVFLRCSGAVIKRALRCVFVDSDAMVKADGIFESDRSISEHRISEAGRLVVGENRVHFKKWRYFR
jgi:hypothetical protein